MPESPSESSPTIVMADRSSTEAVPGEGGAGAIWVLPIALCLYAVALPSAYGPSAVVSADPSYYFFFDSLNLLLGEPLHYINQPATPVTIVTAAAIRLHHRLFGSGDVASSAIAHAPAIMRGVFAALLVSHAAVVAGVGILVRRRGGSSATAFAVQAVPFLVGNWKRLEPLTSECLLVSAVLILAWSCVVVAQRLSESPPAGMLLGITAGLCAAIKVIALPVAILPFVVLRGYRSRFTCAFATLVGFALGTMPLWPDYTRFVHWIGRVAGHQGPYGAGSPGLPALSSLAGNLLGLLVTNPLYVGLLFAGAWTLRATGGPTAGGDRVWRRLLAGVTLVGAAQLLLVSKQPSSHFLIPARATAGVAFLCLLELNPTIRAWFTVCRRMAIGYLAAAVTVTMVLLPHVGRVTGPDPIEKLLHEKYEGWTRVYYGGTSALAYALQRGHVEVGAHHGDALRDQLGDVYFYHGSRGCTPSGSDPGVFDWDGRRIAWSEIAARSGGVVLVGASPTRHSDGRVTIPDDDNTWSEVPVALTEIVRTPPDRLSAILLWLLEGIDGAFGTRIAEDSRSGLFGGSEAVSEARLARDAG